MIPVAGDSLVILLIATAIVIAGLASACLAKRRLRKRLDERWGKPNPRPTFLESIAQFHHFLVDAGGRPAIDDRTWADLDLDRVFEAVDHTSSPVGRQALYHRLRTYHRGPDRSVEQLVQKVTSDITLRDKLRQILIRLDETSGYFVWRLCLPEAIPVRPWFVLFPILGLIPLLVVIAAAFSLVPWALAAVTAITMAAINMFVRAVVSWRLSWSLAPLHHVGGLVLAAREIRSALATADSGTWVDDGDLRRLRGTLLVGRWLSRNPETDGEIVASIAELLNLVFLLDVNAAYFGSRLLRSARSSLLAVIEGVGKVDCALSIASYRAGLTRQWCIPEFGGDRLAGTSVEHPLLESPVPNDVSLAAGTGLLLTGANMAGKSTYLRTVGVNVILAQALDTALARQFQCPWLAVRSHIGRSDDLVEGRSYYLAEVERLLDLVRRSRDGEPQLFLLDEIFRGTNAVERLAAAEAVLLELLEDPNGGPPRHIVLAATHDGELVEWLAHRYRAGHFGDTMDEDGLTFDYRLMEGPAISRNAIKLLEHKGAPGRLTSRAVARAETLDRIRETRR